MVAGSKLAQKHLNAIIQACSAETGEGRFDPKQNKALRKAIRAARECHIPENYIRRVMQFARAGL